MEIVVTYYCLGSGNKENSLCMFSTGAAFPETVLTRGSPNPRMLSPIPSLPTQLNVHKGPVVTCASPPLLALGLVTCLVSCENVRT